MWKKPYTLKEGTAIVLGLIITGIILQLSLGTVEWGYFAWPANIITLLLLIAMLLTIFYLRKSFYFCRFITTMQAAIPAIAAAVIITIAMGLTKQVPEGKPAADPIGFTKMLSAWPFILVYLWMTIIVGEVAILQIAHFSWRKLPTLMSHLGLFIVITCGTLGSADMQRVKMFCEIGKPEWRALDAWNNVRHLPIAIELQKFTIDQYPPKLMVINNDGKPLPLNRPDNVIANKAGHIGNLGNWKIEVVRLLDSAMPEALEKMVGKMPQGMMAQIRLDSLGMTKSKNGFIPSDAPGSECALLIKATREGQARKGWVSCGSYAFPYAALPLDKETMLVMSNREPRKFASTVNIYTQDGKNIQTDIEVNKPYEINGWKIYQLSYNEQMGRWSTLSVFELVTDPWLPTVYAGIFLLLIGAVGMFLTAGKKTKETK